MGIISFEDVSVVYFEINVFVNVIALILSDVIVGLFWGYCIKKVRFLIILWCFYLPCLNCLAKSITILKNLSLLFVS